MPTSVTGTAAMLPPVLLGKGSSLVYQPSHQQGRHPERQAGGREVHARMHRHAERREKETDQREQQEHDIDRRHRDPPFTPCVGPAPTAPANAPTPATASAATVAAASVARASAASSAASSRRPPCLSLRHPRAAKRGRAR